MLAGAMLRPILFACASLAAISASAWADDRRARSTYVTQLTACRAVREDNARLQCYDKAVAALDQAESAKQVVILDQAQVDDTKKRLFGITLPRLPAFAGGADVDQIETTLDRAEIGPQGGWIFRLADGATWIQTDDYTMPGRPKQGEKVIVRRAALGSFRLTVNGRPGVKVRRQN